MVLQLRSIVRRRGTREGVSKGLVWPSSDGPLINWAEGIAESRKNYHLVSLIQVVALASFSCDDSFLLIAYQRVYYVS